MALLDMRFLRYIGIRKKPKAPWLKYYSKKEQDVRIPNVSIYNFWVYRMKKYNLYDNCAINYYGQKRTYRELLYQVDEAAKAFKYHGIRKGDVVTILSANIPEAVISFYALNKIGAVPNLLHPMLSENEIRKALQDYSSVMLVAIDVCYKTIKKVVKDTRVYKTIIISAKDSMGVLMKAVYSITQSYKIRRPHFRPGFITWKEFIKSAKYYRGKKIDAETTKDDPGLILQSGGTTGTPKGIVLSNGNFHASTLAALKALSELDRHDKILGIMPIFHGFGLGISINDALCIGAEIVLIPRFKASEFDKLLVKHNPSVLVGVPTLFSALTTNERMEGVSLANLKYVISGGDTLKKSQVEDINQFLHDHGARTNLMQGFGMTECVSVVSVDLKNASKPGTIGIPVPGVYVKIIKPETEIEVPYGEEGEICICGNPVMLGYYNNAKETNATLRLHADGNLWLHSGDIGSMDKDGFITYKQRLKRMIVSSGYNVYPSQIEEVIEKHPAVLDVNVIGVPHPYKVEVPKAYIVLKKGYYENKEIREEIMELCNKNLAHYSIPKELEFRSSLPKTIIGKVDFRKLQEENIAKRGSLKEER